MNKKNLTIKETFALAIQNHQNNNFKIAENFYKEILEKNPNHFESIFLLGSLSIQIKNFDTAIQLLNKAIQIKPDHANAYHNLGLVFKILGKLQEAMNYCQKAIQIKPDHAEAYNNLGLIFIELREFQKAVSCYQKVIQIHPNHAGAYNNLGAAHKELEEFNKAISCYQKAIQIKPDHANAYHNLGLVFKILGKFKDATNCCQKSLKHEPKNLITLYDLSELKEEVLDLNLKNRINKIMDSNDCTKKNFAYGNFLLAKYELRAKNYNKEFNYLLKGHQCYFESESKNFNKGIEYWLNELPKTKELFNFNKFNKNIKKINYKIKPIFIIGFPRCGSTLVEKIIASGQKYISTGEETNILNALVGKKLQQKKLLNLDIEYFKTRLIENYKQKGLIHEKSDYTFTDKTLDNFFFIGLIKEIFANAKVIHCRRNALSSIMSLLKNNLRVVSWAHNLEHIFKFFDIYYQTIQKFKKIYPNFIYELEYEKLVSDPEIESKKLMKFCDLAWDKKCLEFYKRKDLISQTASNVQIRKAIYKDSIKKYLPYKQFLSKYGDKYFWFN